MIAPRLEIDLDKIRHNATVLAARLRARGVAVTGVTKACMGDYRIAEAFLSAGIGTLGDSRIENIEAIRRENATVPITLIRSPMLSQVDRVVAHADVSFNTELDVISALSTAARRTGRRHGVVLMVELGDLREGIMPGDLAEIARRTRRFPNIVLRGIGANLACQSGVSPDAGNMGELSRLADGVAETFCPRSGIVSGGNSSNLLWAFGAPDIGRINDLRLGESILLGQEPLHRRAIDGLYVDAFTLVAEVIEMKSKPSQPWGEIAQTAFGKPAFREDRGDVLRAILAVGHQDIDPAGLTPPAGIELLGASSDHLVCGTGGSRVAVGSEIAFQPNYSALLRAMTSGSVTKIFSGDRKRLHAPCGLSCAEPQSSAA
ncbi:alanine/ornithine racemase family PLP-dependent enzyme [Oricola nitratireducens]|uniref:alanine/ornithine racemase family PLP-dependent enzyme n=1 Tax=Oricola nitratireducens TaxID=2775868 RepID=UPI0018686C11|nr:alanine/ornithine racemase family PLP-dependent enzyme [Oricola nitratireducens]